VPTELNSDGDGGGKEASRGDRREEKMQSEMIGGRGRSSWWPCFVDDSDWSATNSATSMALQIVRGEGDDDG